MGYMGHDRQRIPVWIAWQRRTAAPEPAVELCGHDILASKLLAPDTPVPRCATSGGHMAEAGKRTLPDDGLWHRQHSLCYFWLVDLFPLRTNRHHSQPILTADATRLHLTISAASQLTWGKKSQRNSQAPSTQPINMV